MKGTRVVMWTWVWVWTVSLTPTHAHSTRKDPHMDPDILQRSGWHSGVNGGLGGVDGGLSNHLAVELVGDEEAAKHLASKYNLHYVRQVFTDPPIYHLHKPLDRDNSRRGGVRQKRSTHSNLTHMLALEPGVKWVNQQRAFVRDKRDRRYSNPPTFYHSIYPTSYHSINPTSYHRIPSRVQGNRAFLDHTLLRTHQRDNIVGSRRQEGGDERLLKDWGREEDGVLGDWEEMEENLVEPEIRRVDTTTDEENTISLVENRRRKGEEYRVLENWPREEMEMKEYLAETEIHGKDKTTDEQKTNRDDQLKGKYLDGSKTKKSPKFPKFPTTEERTLGQTVQEGSHSSSMGSRGSSHLCPGKFKNLTNLSLLKSLATSYVRHQNSPKFRDVAKRLYSQKKSISNTDNFPEAKIGSYESEDGIKSNLESEKQTKPSSSITDAKERLVDLVKSVLEFNDPLYKDQWYLVNTGQLGQVGHDLNVSWAWGHGLEGQGIVVSILDDGIQTTNPDIAENYASEISYSVVRDNQSLDDPSPRLDPPTYTNSHGTYCSGVVAAVANNGICGVGVAYRARVGGVRVVDGKVTDIQEATALSRHATKVDVFSASWGPPDDGTRVEGPDTLAQQALHYGVTKGRGGRGVVYVWAAGNGGLMSDNCNLDGYTSSRYTLSVAALTSTGTSTFYEEPCASTLAAVYIGGTHTLEAARELHRSHKKQMRVVVPELDGHCSQGFQGSSAAAPLMAGVVALALQANPHLTWRDVQHLVVTTSEPTREALLEDGWSTNTRGRHFHLLQGFGAVNAGKLVEAAMRWNNVPPQKMLNVSVFEGYRPLRPLEWVNVTCHLPSPALVAVEHVIATISLSHPERRHLEIYIVSPGGTQSQVLTHRPNDQSTAGFRSWDFLSVHFWGEAPKGRWLVAVGSDSNQGGYLKGVRLQLFGT